jgi:hypothetical protein
VKVFNLACIVLLIFSVSCNQAIIPETINWHEQGLDLGGFIPASFSLPLGTTHQVTGYIKDGYVRFQGDILLSEASISPQVTYVASLWKNKRIPYSIHPDLPKALKDKIAKAVRYYNQETNLAWVKRTTQKDYVEFSPSSTCASYVGRKGGRQPILAIAQFCMKWVTP